MQTLHGYTVDETQWKSKGGGGQCNIAKKGGKEYFIKRLAFPRYPDSDNFKGAFKQQKIDICNDWYRRRQEIIRAIPGSGTGTTVKPIEYFREGPCYYEVANLIDVTSIPYDEIYKESKEDKARVMLTVAMSLADLHKKGIVHGDLDPRNILISRVAGSKNLVTKLIDFSDSFFENDPPETIMSKDFWWSPEVAFYSKAAASGVSPNPYKKYISCKADVFSLGIVFHQYCAKYERGISDFFAAERLDGAEKRGSESIIPVNLYRMCEIGGVICHFLETPANPWGLAEKSWLP